MLETGEGPPIPSSAPVETTTSSPTGSTPLEVTSTQSTAAEQTPENLPAQRKGLIAKFTRLLAALAGLWKGAKGLDYMQAAKRAEDISTTDKILSPKPPPYAPNNPLRDVGK